MIGKTPKHLRDYSEKGATMLEYALIASLIAGVSIAGVNAIGLSTFKTNVRLACTIACRGGQYPYYLFGCEYALSGADTKEEVQAILDDAMTKCSG